jgi:hypothetical protein
MPRNADESYQGEIVLKPKDEKTLEAAFTWLAERLPGQPAA